jgi:hypothetical protein
MTAETDSDKHMTEVATKCGFNEKALGSKGWTPGGVDGPCVVSKSIFSNGGERRSSGMTGATSRKNYLQKDDDDIRGAITREDIK